MRDYVLAYLIIGMGLWLISYRHNLFPHEGNDPDIVFVGNVLLTATLILLWPLMWAGAIVAVISTWRRSRGKTKLG